GARGQGCLLRKAAGDEYEGTVVHGGHGQKIRSCRPNRHADSQFAGILWCASVRQGRKAGEDLQGGAIAQFVSALLAGLRASRLEGTTSGLEPGPGESDSPALRRGSI